MIKINVQKCKHGKLVYKIEDDKFLKPGWIENGISLTVENISEFNPGLTLQF